MSTRYTNVIISSKWLPLWILGTKYLLNAAQRESSKPFSSNSFATSSTDDFLLQLPKHGSLLFLINNKFTIFLTFQFENL